MIRTFKYSDLIGFDEALARIAYAFTGDMSKPIEYVTARIKLLDSEGLPVSPSSSSSPPTEPTPDHDQLEAVLSSHSLAAIIRRAVEREPR